MKKIRPVSLLQLLVAGLFALNTAQAVPPPGGNAPVDPPPYGFAIDGDLMANTPEINVGDWITNTNLAPGTGGSVLTLAGVPINPSRTFHLRDPFLANDNVFKGGMKWRDNPNLWQWTTNKASAKTDINNALLHLTSDTNGHIWAVAAADRLSTSGESYIDFEFLQASLTANANSTFTSGGTNGGRTVGDLVFSLAFVGGGSYADFFAFRWQTNGVGGFTYVDVTAALPVGQVFLAFNSNTVAVPYGAFNGTTYDPNAFVEAAIDLTALLGNFDQCASFGFKTIMIKTKSSSSDTATIEDFITPFQYTLRIGPDAQAGPDQVRCIEGAETVFPLAGSAGSGLSTVVSTTWSVLNGSATIADTNSPVTTARVSSPSATLRLTVVQANGCTATDDIVLTVQQPPVCAINGPAAICPRTTNTYSAPVGMTTYAWTVSGNGFISGPTNQTTVKVIAGAACGQGYTLSLNMRSNVCTVSCVSEVLVTDTTLPVLTCPPDRVLDCPANTATNATGVATATDSCSRVTVTYSDAVTNGCGISKVIARTWTATDECGNAVSCVQTITVRDITRPTITCPPNRTLDCPADISTNANGVATATDLCGAATITFNDVITTNCGNTFVIARTWTATDLCGNSTNCVQTLTVRDITPPVITCPTNLTLECPADTMTNATGMATATDACNSVTITYSDSVTNQCGGTSTIRRTWTATDACGNKSTCLQILTVRDTTPPVITCPPNLTLDCPAVTTTNNTGVATATDTCGTVTITFTDSTTNGCSGTKTVARTWRATDQCGNQSSCVQTIVVRDITPPIITCPPAQLLECPATTSTNVTGRATATDTCSTVVIAFTDTVTNQCTGARIISRRWTATDQCGNQSSCIQTIVVRDTTLPVLTCPPNRVLNCPANTTTNATGIATATDSCSPARVTYSDVVTNGCGISQVIARTWTATDECGNNVSCIQTITVRDTNAPSITCPPNVTRECGQDTSPAATGTATATDACGSATISFSDAVTPLCPGSQIITRIWRATDACGNQASCQQTITVRDTTPPTFAANVICSFSADQLVSGEGASLLAANYATLFPQGLTLGIYAPSNNNAAPNGLFWTANNPGLSALQDALALSGTNGAITQDAQNSTTTFGAGELGRQTLALTVNLALNKSGLVGAGPNNFGNLIYTQAGDSLSGRSVQAILAMVNQSLAGMSLPAGHTFASLTTLLENLNGAFQNCNVSTFAKTRLSAPAVLVSCSAQIPAPNFNLIVASDSCSSATISGLPDVVTNSTCANRLTLLRSWRATDACSNSTTVTLTIIVADTNGPTMVCPPNITLEYPANLNPTNTGTATATDNCGVAGINYSDTATITCGVGRIITRTWSAWDACMNVSTCVQTITVRDTTPPVITCPTNPTVECGSSTAPAATGTATATDLSGNYTITNSDSITPGCGGSYTISRRWTAFDACGNAASCTQIIQVRDTTPPVITCPANRTLECPANISTNNTGIATASDSCSAVTVTFSDSSATVCGNARIISRTWRATDACGNFSTCVQTLTIRDITPPTISAPTNITVECGGSIAPSTTGTATSTDACNSVTVNFSDSVSNSCGNARTILRRWVAMDSCNNSNVAFQTITVRDTTAPTLTLPPNRVLDCPATTTTNATGVATAVDVCGSVTITYSEVVSNSCGITKTIWRTWRATDQCGNSATGVQTITVRDNPPTMSCPTVSVQCVDDLPPAYTNLAAFRAAGGVANDPCDANLDFVLVSNSVLIGSCPARMTRVYRVTDDCGLSTQCTQTVVVDDTIAPTLTCLPNVTVECGTSLDTNTLGTVTATDNCSPVVITRTDNPVGSFYNLKWYGSDPELGTGPYSPTYVRLGPASLPCPTGGRAIDPLRNAVCYAPGGSLDALTSLGGVPLSYGQVVPFQLVIEVSGAPGAEKGVIEVTPSWSTHTTSNDRFGFDTNYMVYCAFVDPADPGSIDPHFNAKVDSLNSYLFDRGTINEQIRGTLRISGLDPGDRIIVEIWMVMQSTQPDHVGGTIASEISSARKLSIPAEDITIGNETISIGNLSKFTALPPAQPQPPQPPIPPQPPVPPGRTTSVIDRTWAATDDCGNRSTCVQRITVRDTTAPSLTAPNLVLECPADTSTNSTGMATVFDACGLVTLGYSDVVSNACSLTKTIVRTWKATDGNLNTNTIVQTITVADTTPPTLGTVTNKTITAGQPLVFDTPGALDLCGLTTTVGVVSTTTNVLSGGSYTVTRTWQATDACGNQSGTQSQTITVNSAAIASLTKLTISANGASGILLRWPTNAAGYRLECAESSDTKKWNVVPITPIVTNGECRVYMSKTGHCQMFRLANTPPYLESAKVSGGNLRLTWPTQPSGFQLEASDTMANGSWAPVAIVPGVSNALNHVIVSPVGAKKFYRLKK